MPKTNSEKKVQISFKVKKRTKDRVEALSKKVKESTSEVARFAFEKGISIAEREME